MDNQEVANNILVIGNGFDLAHGLPTTYDNFICAIRSKLQSIRHHNKKSHVEEVSLDYPYSKIVKNGFIEYFLNYVGKVPGWVDMERLIKDIIAYFESFFSDSQNKIDFPGTINLTSESFLKIDLLDKRLKECVLLFPLFDEKKQTYGCLKKEYYTEEFGLNKREVIKLLRSQLNEVIELLRLYLQNYCYDKQKGNLKAIKQISDIHPSYVISFNYTDTYKVYGIKTEDVFHVHGNLEKDNMVLGFDDDEPENLDFIYFKKYFQRIQKLTGYIDDSKFKKMDIDFDGNNHMKAEKKALVHFYGHSMDKTDGDIIKKLKELSSGFVIYVRDPIKYDDYERKVINLIDIFGKDDATKMIETGFIKFKKCE